MISKLFFGENGFVLRCERINIETRELVNDLVKRPGNPTLPQMCSLTDLHCPDIQGQLSRLLLQFLSQELAKLHRNYFKVLLFLSLPKKIADPGNFANGPPLALRPKWAILSNFGKLAISQIIGLFSCGLFSDIPLRSR